MEALRVYRGLLANRPLSRLFIGEFVSGIGDWLYIVAIFVVIYRESGDAALVGAFGAIRLLPYIFLSVPAGIIADRFERRLVLMVSDLFRGAIMVVLAILVTVDAPVVLIAGFAILAACGSAFFYPAMGAYLPSLVEDERQLGPANSAWATLGNLSYIAGPALGGIILVVGSVTTAFLLNALTFAFVAFVLWRLPRSSRESRAVDAAAEAATASHAAGVDKAAADDAEGGTVAPVADAGPDADRPDVSVPARPAPPGRSLVPMRPLVGPLVGLTVIQLMSGFLGGGYQVITVILAIDILQAGEAANGYLNTAIGVGGLLGGISAGALVLRRSLNLPLIVGATLMGAGTVALGYATSLPFALVTIGVASAGALIIEVLADTLFQRLVPNDLLGRGVGVLMTVSTVMGAAGAFALPVLVQSVGPMPSFLAAGVLTIVLTVIAVALIGSASTRKLTPYEAVIARVARLDLFTGVPNARLERAMRQLKEVPVAAGEDVVRQGEPADRFYIIERGTFTVTQVPATGGERVVLRQLGPDQVFGELGLLDAGPRTATVTADVDGVVLALEGEEFLTLVGASGALSGRLRGLYMGAGGGSR